MNTDIILSLAPFQGITDVVYRNCFKKHFAGIDKYYTPFFSGIQKDHAKNLQTEEIDPKYNDIATLTPQILSNDGEEIVRFGEQCKQMGYREINLNLGCPFPRVANKKRGSGLLPHPVMIEEILSKVFQHIDVAFSIKCRLGYFNPDEILPLVAIFNAYPISELIIHPRIGKQLYKGNADVERFKSITTKIKAPSVYNGDIVSRESFLQISKTIAPVSVFMLGRGLLANPFLAEQIKGMETGDKQNRLLSFVAELYGERLQRAGGSPKVLGRMKELWSYLSNAFDDPQAIWRKIKKINTLNEYEEAIQSIFNERRLDV